MNTPDPSPTAWFTSRYSQPQGECVEVAFTRGTAHTRDSKNRNGPALTFPADSWQSFIRHLASDDDGA